LKPTCLRHAVILLSLCFQAFALSWNAWNNSPTLDEPAHLQAGLEILWDGRLDLYAVNPPLIRSISAIPGRLLGLRPVEIKANRSPEMRWEFVSGTELFATSSDKAMRSLSWGRLCLIPLVLLGALLVWTWSKAVFCEDSACLALMLWCFSPMVLGHGALITPDVGAAVCGAFALFRFRAWLLDGTYWNAYLWGLSSGLALLSKFTWLPVLPVAFFACYVIWYRFVWNGNRSWRRDALQSSMAIATSLILVNAVFSFDGTFTPLGEIPFISESFKPLKPDLSNSTAGIAPTRIANRFAGTLVGRIPVPLPKTYVQGIDIQKRDFDTGAMSDSYLLGQWRSYGWYYYYALAAFVKEPTPTLVIAGLFCALIVVSLSRTRRSQVDGITSASVEKKKLVAELSVLLVPALTLFILVSSQTGFNHHYRYLLGMYPLLFICLSGTIKVGKQLQWSWVGWTCGFFMATQVVCVAASFPDYISYFNVVVGGPRGARDYLSDSSIDWGQDLLRLRDWQQKHVEAEPMFVFAFTSVKPAHLGVVSAKLRLRVAEPGKVHVMPLTGFPAGWYAISDCVYQGRQVWTFDDFSIQRIFKPGEFDFFQTLEPIDRVGGSIDVFHIKENELAVNRN